MQNILIYKNNEFPEFPDYLGIGEILNEDGLTEEEEHEKLEQMAKDIVPLDCPYQIVNREWFYSTYLVHPQLRNCLVYNNGDFGHDINKIREWKKNCIRVDRKPLFDELDARFIRAMEDGTPTAAIVEEKNRLRYLTDYLDDLIDIEQILAVTTDLEYDWQEYVS